MFNRLNFNTENKRVEDETIKKIKYMIEEKYQLEREIRVGEDAKEKLENLEEKLKANMIVYACIDKKFL